MIHSARVRAIHWAFLLLLPSALLAANPGMVTRTLPYTPAPLANPLKGLVPYAGRAGTDFPYTLEFNYLPLAALMTGPGEFDWSPLENLLNDVASRGRQTIFRIYLEYPAKPTGIPAFLIEAGLKTHAYTNTNTQPLPPALVTTPDYEDTRLRAALKSFIGALGKRYDGDARIGYITAGLLGTWGEWHTHPRTDLMPSKTVQTEVMDAYEAAFKKTPILLRYPAGEDDPRYAPNHNRPFGYHDDSFGWATRPTDRPSDDWFFLTRLQKAGPNATNKWRTHPIGGEIRPELWQGLWNDPSSSPEGQEFGQCVLDTHVTWLMDSSTTRPLTGSQRQKAFLGIRRMGYEYWIWQVDHSTPAPSQPCNIRVLIRNVGIAPFYHDWPIELGLIADGNAQHTFTTPWKLSERLPRDPDRFFELTLSPDQQPTGTWQLALRVVNPLPNGFPLRFAGMNQDQHAPGWFTLTEITFP
jgi:hypothetical protein